MLRLLAQHRQTLVSGISGARHQAAEHVPHFEPPRVVLKSASPAYESYERLADEIRIVGRAVAVWVSRRLWGCEEPDRW